MATNPIVDLLTEGLAAPLGDVIAAVGQGVADAQRALDEAALAASLAVYDDDGDAGTALLREIGYRPTFYVLPETTCEVHVSMRVGGTGGADGSAGTARVPGALAKGRTYVTPVDAGFQQRFGYQASAAAKLSFRIVPVPPPAALDDARPVPDLVGRDGPLAVAALATLGLGADVRGADGAPLPAEGQTGLTVQSQEPLPRRLLPVGATVRLTLA